MRNLISGHKEKKLCLHDRKLVVPQSTQPQFNFRPKLLVSHNSFFEEF
jgi:hypothetical protein